MTEKNIDVDATPEVETSVETLPPVEPTPNIPPAPPKESTSDVELRAARRKIAAFEKQNKDREDADKSELEISREALAESQRQFAESEERNLMLQKRQAVSSAVATLGGSKRQSAISKLVNFNTITVDEDGNLVGIDEAVNSVFEDVPELFASNDKAPKFTSSPAPIDKQSDKNPNPTKIETTRDLGREIAKKVSSHKNKARL